MITREFNLYLHAGHSIPLVINVNQYDQGEQWLFTLFNADGTQYVPSSGAIVGIKADNLGIINTGTVNSAGQVEIMETQQMTAAAGKAVFELVIDDGTHGTANFVVLVEPKPGNNADLSETDISMIEQAIEAASNIKPYGSPLVASTVAGMTDHEKVYVYVGSETGYTSGNWYYWDGDSWESGGVYNSVAVQTDTTLTLSGVAADAKKTGDEIADLKSQIAQSSGVPSEVKSAMDALFAKMAVKDDDSYLSEYTVIHAWATSLSLVSISAVFTQGTAKIFDDTPLTSLKALLTVTATYSDASTAEITDYALSGDLDSAISTITVTYQGKTAAFNVDVTLPVFDYNSVRDGLLSTFNGITTYQSSASNWSETLEDNILKIRGTGSQNDYYQFKIGTNPATGKWRMTINAQIKQITTTGSQQALGLRPQISDGTKGIRFGFKPDGTVLANKSGTTLTSVGSIELGEIWHTIEARLDTSIPNQKIIIDGTTIMNISTLGTLAANNSVFFIAACIVYVKTIKLYDLTDAEEPSESEE